MKTPGNPKSQADPQGRLGFEKLTDLPLLKRYAKAFEMATGVPFTIIPPNESNACTSSGDLLNPFCSFLNRTEAGSKKCLEAQHRTNGVHQNHKGCCFAGLTKISIPVMNGEQHIATLVSNQAFPEHPTRQKFEKLMKKLGIELKNGSKGTVSKAYLDTPVIPLERFQAITELLDVFARHLAEDATRNSLAKSENEPKAVSEAKLFVHAHHDTPITLDQVLQHVHASRFHFCKIFKKSTGMTLTEYIARVRVEKAKVLLLDFSLRISDVVFSSGFGSIPQFNNVFKRIAGMSPTEYRRELRKDTTSPN